MEQITFHELCLHNNDSNTCGQDRDSEPSTQNGSKTDCTAPNTKHALLLCVSTLLEFGDGVLGLAKPLTQLWGSPNFAGF